ncbi:MAG: sulfatase [Bryobacterales bacterium]|nr:sulfatase [Bryobacterales bacterium]
MNRRRFLFGSLAATMAAPLGGMQTTPAARKRNVLFIAVDDLRPELGCYGHRSIRSPHIDALAGRGMRFDRAYCQQAVCAPTRASLLTGTRPDTTRVWDLQSPLNTVNPELVSIPRHFRKHGYETISLGKIYHHRDEDPEAWSERPWQPRIAEGGNWRAYRDPLSLMTEAHGEAALEEAREAGKREGKAVAANAARRGPAYEGPDVEDNAYPDGMTCDKAIAELGRLKDKPFFLAVGFLKPHLPFNAPKKYWDLYGPGDLELPERRSWPEGMPEVAKSEWGELRSYAGIPAKGEVDEGTLRMLIHGYYACVSYTDAQVGRLMAELDRLQLRESTTVILWGDHGWKLGDYGAWCKHTNFELDTHVPMVLSVPGQKNAGGSTRALVEYVDVYPTLAEASGLPVPAQCEGKSMMPLLEDPGRKWKEAAFSQYPRGGQMMGYTLRTERWRYTEWIHRPSGEIRERELYDHAESDVATANLAALRAHAETVKELSRLLDKGQGWRKVREAV